MATFVQCVLSCRLSHWKLLILFQSNVLCSKGRCYLTDFGISKMPGISSLTTFAQRVDCSWAAPELTEQRRNKQSDIFAFACTVYEVHIHFLNLPSDICICTHQMCLKRAPDVPLVEKGKKLMTKMMDDKEKKEREEEQSWFIFGRWLVNLTEFRLKLCRSRSV